MRYYYCPKCQVLKPASECEEREGKMVHEVEVHGYGVSLYHPVIEEP